MQTDLDRLTPIEMLEYVRSQVDRLAALEQKISALEQERQTLRDSACDLECRLKRYETSEDEWNWFFTNSPDMLIVHEADGRLKRVSPAVTRVLGYTTEEFLPLTLVSVMHPDDLERTRLHLQNIATGVDGINFECRLRHKDGSWRWLAWTTPAPKLYDGVASPAFAMARDITESKLSQQELLYRAQHDALTGLTNRATFDQAVQQALARNGRQADGRVSLMLLDLDGFKTVNDTHGHLAGDAVLRTVAQRLANAGRKGDLVARLGGDEFSCLLEGAPTEALDSVAQRMLAVIRLPIAIGDIEVQVGCSIGIATFPTTAADATALFEQADRAMYGVKQRGKQAAAHFHC
ncbi:MAG: sensor domain-containing diguanylate cyclase [Pseudomonadota bacterium]